MAHVIVAPETGELFTPNDCGCSEHRLPQPALALADRAAAQLPLAHAGLRPHLLLRTLPLDDGYAVAFVPSLSRVAVIDAWASALLARLPLDAPGPSGEERAALGRLAAAGLLADSPSAAIPRPAPPQTLVAWLHLTTACNLRCSYCYIAKSDEHMSAATARAAVDAAVRSAIAGGYRRVVLKYAGGEPTLRLPLIVETHCYAQEQLAAAGLELVGGVLTNGTLITAATAAALRELGLSLMVSLDGDAATNDAQRPTLGGRPSFAPAMAGIAAARAAGLQVTVGITVTAPSVEGLPGFVRALLADDLPFGISFYRAHRPGADPQVLGVDDERLLAGMRAAYAEIAARPPRWSVLSSLLDRADLSAPHLRSCAAGEHYLVFDHRGRLASCQMTIAQPVTTVGVKDPLSLIRSAPGALVNPPVDEREGCAGCEWRYWCGGGCSVASHRATGRYDARSPNCGIYLALYPELLRLEGRRLLHWHAGAA